MLGAAKDWLGSMKQSRMPEFRAPWQREERWDDKLGALRFPWHRPQEEGLKDKMKAFADTCTSALQTHTLSNT